MVEKGAASAQKDLLYSLAGDVSLYRTEKGLLRWQQPFSIGRTKKEELIRGREKRLFPVVEKIPGGERKNASRLIKRRTVANEACDAGRVLVNGKQARASYDVKEGDVLELHLGERVLKAQVLSVTEYAKKEEAAGLYRMLEE